MYIPERLIGVGQLAPPIARTALLPPGIGFMLAVVRQRVRGDAESALAVMRSFDAVGWPRGELVLDALLDCYLEAPAVLPHRACALSRDELALVRAAALLALGLEGHAKAELAPALPGRAVEASAALGELVSGLSAAGLGFSMMHVPGSTPCSVNTEHFGPASAML